MAKTELPEAREGAELEVLERLEKRVETAARMIHELRTERDELKEKLAAREERIGELEGEMETNRSSGSAVERLEKERDELLRDRATVIQRVESILERLEATGLD
jgi:FtsZ-binding cell division protein ZapB